jgi:hypothetical protein
MTNGTAAAGIQGPANQDLERKKIREPARR